MRRAIITPRSSWFIAVLFAAVCGRGAETNAAARSVPAAGTNSARPAKWAVKVDRPNLSNFYRLNTNFYRGAQPGSKGMAELKAMGIRTVLDLRSMHSDDDEARGLGLKLERLRTKPWHSEEEDVVEFLKIAAATNNYPLFVHCQRGADRTGLMCAMYRVVFDGWTKPEAIQEMKDGGYHFDPRWKNIVTFVENADVADLKKKAGISEPLKK